MTTLAAPTSGAPESTLSLGDDGDRSRQGAAFHSLTEDHDLSALGQRRRFEDRCDPDIGVLSHVRRDRGEFRRDGYGIAINALNGADGLSAATPTESTAALTATELRPKPLDCLRHFVFAQLAAPHLVSQLSELLLGHRRDFRGLALAFVVLARLRLRLCGRDLLGRFRLRRGLGPRGRWELRQVRDLRGRGSSSPASLIRRPAPNCKCKNEYSCHNCQCSVHLRLSFCVPFRLARRRAKSNALRNTFCALLVPQRVYRMEP